MALEDYINISDLPSKTTLQDSDNFLVEDTSNTKKTTAKDLADYVEGKYPYVTAGKKSDTTLGEKATAEGDSTTASGEYSHAEGYATEASGDSSHSEGNGSKALKSYSHAEGWDSIANGNSSHAEGLQTYASGQASHAEGRYTRAIGANSHSEGYAQTLFNPNEDNIDESTGKKWIVAYGTASHAEGSTRTGSIIAKGEGSHAEGVSTKALLEGSHAEGCKTIAGSVYAHAEGLETEVTGWYGHAEGELTKAYGAWSHAEGSETEATGDCSHAANLYTQASYAQTVVGSGNTKKGSDESYTAGSGYFIVGCGDGLNSRANCFRAAENGTYGKTYNTTGADYAEMFEWLDGNVNNEDRAGKFVTLNGDKIIFATSSDDYILGVVSGNPSVCGDVYDDEWKGMFNTDIFGRPIYTKQIIEEEKDEESNIIKKARTNDVLEVNPSYDSTKPYIPRSERPEWSPVGLLGKLVCIDDGTAEVNHYVKVNDDSIATASSERTKYRVMERLDENHIRIMIL